MSLTCSWHLHGCPPWAQKQRWYVPGCDVCNGKVTAGKVATTDPTAAELLSRRKRYGYEKFGRFPYATAGAK